MESLETLENSEEPKKLQVGIIDYGVAGRSFHAPLLKGTGFEIAGIVARTPERQEQAQREHRDADVVTNVDALLRNDLDLVVVASVNHAHFEAAANAIGAGIPVVVEIPIGRDLAMANRLIDFGVENDVPIVPFFLRRWESEALTTARVIKGGRLGKIHRIESRFERWMPTSRADMWRPKSDRDPGVGLLLELQAHLISQALAWAGPAKVAYAKLRHLRGGVDDDVMIVLEHLNGIESWLVASAVSGHAGPRIQVFGDKGSLVIDGYDQQEEMLLDGQRPYDGYWANPVETLARITQGNLSEDIEPEAGDYPAFYRACSTALRGKGLWPVATKDALDVAEILDQARDFLNS